MSVDYALARGIATITLNSPENRNALSSSLVAELTGHLETAAADPAVRAILLTHTGSTFCAGADLAESAAEGGPAKGTQRMVELLRRILEAPKPVIAVIDGNVRAGGLGLVGACDLAVAGFGSSFAFTEARIGVAAAIISLTTRPVMQPRAAARYLLTGEKFGAPVAAEIGLITLAAQNLATEVDELTTALRLASPQGLAETKRLLNKELLARFDQDAQELAALSARLFDSDDAREGIMAFLQKRSPSWVL
ncbi:enoyl-CoA hydratase [Jatrophihabitans sp. GAS493]|uniref:enoyl-CoA hydratase family protein n=1 Tax=Jatrophihabitans sp. GAS493 TaxID=1907575 RepID=UPI000BB7FA46|nr:enoyl-CoA hydratase family protein [Jatrophihabitans sp. GAS493]SOD72612.1 enoyl-CoA hydratase [Jatrophihabitans sp. GAS493]